MSEVLESLHHLKERLTKELLLNPNAAEGLHLALDILRDEIETQQIWEEVDAMTPEQVEAYLLKEGFNLAAIKESATALAARLSGVSPRV